MFFYGRQMYPNNQKNQVTQSSAAESVDISNLKKLILESLEHLSDNMDELKKTINKLSVKIDNIEAKQAILENQIDSEDFLSGRISQSDILNMKAELDLLKKDTPKNSNDNHTRQTNNMPVMPGSGFANVTAEYLRNINKKHDDEEV
ncbi:UNVERIFIED_CONTAM: hypothetical protein Cloal_2001 [Acetivibrio alkalicellulosi]